jgi:hypothetical protein
LPVGKEWWLKVDAYCQAVNNYLMSLGAGNDACQKCYLLQLSEVNEVIDILMPFAQAGGVALW